MHLNNPVIQLCLAGSRAELEGQPDKAHSLYEQAWAIAQDDFEACVAAHYLARHQENPEERLRWNQIALDRAGAVAGGRVQEFYPSLYLNMGSSFELLGNLAEAKRYYDLAAGLGAEHQTD